MANPGKQIKETLDGFKDKLNVEKLDPLEARIKCLEDKIEYQKFSNTVGNIFREQLGTASIL